LTESIASSIVVGRK